MINYLCENATPTQDQAIPRAAAVFEAVRPIRRVKVA
jgi:hypothetical protein